MDKSFLYSVILVVAIGIHQSFGGIIDHHEHKHEPPKPYKFGYEVKDKEGQQYRHEEGDGHGSVRGSYGFVDHKGIHREVHYVADHNGFRAKVITNEPGTANQDPANVKMQASPPKHEILEIPKVHIPHIPKLPSHHEMHQYHHQEKPVQPEHYRVHLKKPYHKVQQLKFEPPVFDHDIPDFDQHFPMHKYQDFQHIPQFKYGQDFWGPDFYRDGHFHHFGKYNPSSYMLGGMGRHHY